jgi:hypothetical protein
MGRRRCAVTVYCSKLTTCSRVWGKANVPLSSGSIRRGDTVAVLWVSSSGSIRRGDTVAVLWVSRRCGDGPAVHERVDRPTPGH